jgi:hypothetical protein
VVYSCHQTAGLEKIVYGGGREMLRRMRGFVRGSVIVGMAVVMLAGA